MKTILVTGGAGYIGSHTVVELLNAGYKVVVADNFCTSKHFIINQIEIITGKKPIVFEGDLCNPTFVQDVFNANQYDAIIHFAAFKAVGESVEQPLKYYKNNLFSLINLLDACANNQIKNFVFSSSCTVYGTPEVLPVSEQTPLQVATSPYGNTKQISEEIITDFVKAKELNAISLRYFNPVGAHKSALIGELPIGSPNNLVPFITQTAIGKREQLSVFGGDYNTPDGTCIRDYIHVVDLAKAHVKAIERLFTGISINKNEFINIGTGKGYSVLEAIKSFEKVSEQKLNYKIVERRAGDVEKVFADTTLSNKILNWKAELNIDDMMLSAWNWEKYCKTNNIE